MMDFTYENQGTNTYLVYEIKADDQIDSMSLGMLTNNKIAGFAPTFFTQMDAQKFIKYNVSAKVSVKQFFNGAVNKKRLLGVFEGIVDGLLSAEDYMIDPSSIVLDLDYIFADVSTCEASLICLPVSSNNLTDLSMFFKNIMFSTQFDQTENCDHVAKIINFLNGSPVVSLNDFKKLLESIKGSAQPGQVASTKPATIAQTQVAQQKVTPAEATPTTSHKAPEQKAKTPANVPPMNQPKVPPVPQTQTSTAGSPAGQKPEKKISMFNLLMHYSKENVEIYKAQRAGEKTSTQAATPKQTPAQQPAKPGVTPSFAIPGQAAPAPSVAAAPATQAVPQSGSQPTVQKAATTPAQQPAYIPRQMPQGQAANFGETTVLGGGAIGETTVLTASNNPAQMIAPHLIRKKNNEKISLNKPVFRVGKERSYVDYFIGDNTAISRSHANFITRENEYFVVDTNSTNHTFVNGTMIQSNVETSIAHGDTIRLANEDFEFKLY